MTALKRWLRWSIPPSGSPRRGAACAVLWNQIVIEGGCEQKQRLLKRLRVNNNQLDAPLSRLAQATAREGPMDEGELNLMIGLI
jgi:hypothetical protein